MLRFRLQDAQPFSSLHPLFAQAFEFLQSEQLASLADGRHAIDGDRLFAICDRGRGRGRAQSPLEYHRRYIDIQYVVAGEDIMGWRPLADCHAPANPFDVAKDLGFLNDTPQDWLLVAAGQAAIFYPADAHAPLATTGEYHKVVIKVSVDAS